MLGNIGMKFATTTVLRRFGLRTVLAGNGVLLAATFALCAAIDAGTPWLAIVAVLVASGMARLMQFTALNTIAFADVAPAAMSRASTVFSTTMQLNAALGVAVGALSLQVAQRWNGHATGAVADFHAAFWVVAALCLLGAISAFGLPADTGRIVTQGKDATL